MRMEMRCLILILLLAAGAAANDVLLLEERAWKGTGQQMIEFRNGGTIWYRTRTGAGGRLYHARKPFQIVSNVAQFDVGSKIEEQVPRWSGYIPDVKLRLAQVGPEIQVATPRAWADFDYGHAAIGYDYTRGYPGSLLRENHELTVRVDILDPMALEFRSSHRSYLNERIIFEYSLEDRNIATIGSSVTVRISEFFVILRFQNQNVLEITAFHNSAPLLRHVL